MKQALYVLFDFILYCWSSQKIVDVYLRRHEVEKGTYRSFFDKFNFIFPEDDFKTKFYMDFLFVNLVHLVTVLYLYYLLMK